MRSRIGRSGYTCSSLLECTHHCECHQFWPAGLEVRVLTTLPQLLIRALPSHDHCRSRLQKHDCAAPVRPAILRSLLLLHQCRLACGQVEAEGHFHDLLHVHGVSHSQTLTHEQLSQDTQGFNTNNAMCHILVWSVSPCSSPLRTVRSSTPAVSSSRAVFTPMCPKA